MQFFLQLGVYCLLVVGEYCNKMQEEKRFLHRDGVGKPLLCDALSFLIWAGNFVDV